MVLVNTSMFRLPTFVRTVAAILLWKCVYLAILFLVISRWGDDSKFGRPIVRWPHEGEPRLESHFAAWDVAHYLLLASEGYSEGERSCAFYPLWPLVIHWINSLLKVNPVWLSVALANLLSALAFGIFYLVSEDVAGERVARCALWLLILYPGALFYQFGYTESLFLLLLLCLVASMRSRNLPFALAAAVLLPMTRAIGVFVLLPILGFLWAEVRGSRIRGHSRVLWLRRMSEAGSTKAGSSGIAGNWILLAGAPVFGWLCYLLLMWCWTGNAFEGLQAQRYWGRHSILNLVNIPRFCVELFTATTWHGFAGSVLDRILFLCFGYTLPLLWLRRRDWFLFGCVLAVIPAMSGGFTSFIRFGSVAFPFFLVWADILSAPKQVLARVVVLSVFLGMQLCLVWRFVNFSWAG